jgi:hypothetical protein
MISHEIAEAIAPFFDKIGPSHDQLNALFRAAGLDQADPARDTSELIGKMRRVRGVLTHAAAVEERAGARLVRDLLAALRAGGSFHPDSVNYPGEYQIRALREAFDRQGYVLDSAGGLRPKNLENLEGVELTEALEAYVHRALQGDPDAALLVGTVKDLIEATARHALVETSGSYDERQGFLGTVFLAFDRLGLATPDTKLLDHLDRDPVKAMQQALCLAALTVNRYRNQEGTGHGRPAPSRASTRDARTASQVAGTVSELLLATLRLHRALSQAST